MTSRYRALTAVLAGLLLVAVLAVALIVKTGYGSELRARLGGRGPEARVVNLDELGQLQAAFNRDTGSARLVVLFSPT